jgi:hypothetical protein
VDLVEVDPVGLQPSQALLECCQDPASRVAAPIDALTHLKMHLRREDDLVAAIPERIADDLLALSVRVRVGGVDEVNAAVEGGVD